jgi:subtilisin family serine protease
MAKNPETGNASAPENQPQGTQAAQGQSTQGQGAQGNAPQGAEASGNPKRAAAPPQQQGGSSSGAGQQGQQQPAGERRTVSPRKGQYLIAARRTPGMQMMGLQPLSSQLIEQSLRAMPDVEVVDTVGPKTIMGALADGFADAPSVLVAKMTEEKAVQLHQQGQGRLIVERDQSLAMLEPSFQLPPLVGAVAPTAGPVLTAAIVVLGKDNKPVPDAEVYLFGSFLPATGVTDAQGQVTLTLYGETEQTVKALYVKPKSDYWSFYQQQPDITTGQANVVGLRPLSEVPSLAGFPEKQVYTWGQKAMRLDQLPGDYRGQGVKVAVVDSGAANRHDDLANIRFGFDIINKKTNPDTWNDDTVAHGSHCAGVIAGADNAKGIRGFAPDAEIHACRLFPGGQVSQLIDALEYCIEKQVDVVNLSLGGADPSEALEQQLQRARRAGIACIVAAGNSGGPVQYPASSPQVLAVSAIGKLSEFPADSYHAQTVTPFYDAASGYYAAKFSCFGPEVAVCGPGVAITSSVPPNNYAVWDGTSMAAPHITGLAALILAHHPDFRTVYRERNADRVDRLFQIIRMSARRVNVGDASRTGFGLPDVLVAVGLQSMAGVAAAAAVAPQSAAIGGLLGSAAGVQMLAPQGFHPYGAVYADQQQLSPQAYASAQLQQFGQQFGGLDPGYAAYIASVYGQGRFPFMGFGRQW